MTITTAREKRELSDGFFVVKGESDEGTNFKELDQPISTPSKVNAFLMINKYTTINDKLIDWYWWILSKLRLFLRHCFLIYSKKYWAVQEQRGITGEEFGQSKNNYGDDRLFSGLLLGPKVKHWLTRDEYGVLKEKRTLKGYQDADRTQNYFIMKERTPITIISQSGWKERLSIVCVSHLKKI